MSEPKLGRRWATTHAGGLVCAPWAANTRSNDSPVHKRGAHVNCWSSIRATPRTPWYHSALRIACFGLASELWHGHIAKPFRSRQKNH